MKKLLAAPLLLCTIALLSFQTFSELPIGSSMPLADRKMKDVSGAEISLKEAVKKNGLLVMFSCNTCPYVIKNQQRTLEAAAYASRHNMGVVLVNSNEALRNADDSYEEMKKYAKSQSYRWNYVVDEASQLADAFGASRTPEVFLFNNEGKLVYHGAIDDNPADESAVGRKHLQMAIDEMTTGKDISVKTSRSVGCSIKRVK